MEGSMIGKQTLQQKWREQSEAAKREAKKLPHGKQREHLLRMARQLQTASQINEWLSSPALQPPK
jgi:archaellum biogenesis protein FlaJ (TadC family)